MIKLNKLNGVEILVNSEQIQYIEAIPESKIVMMNSEYLLVKESIDDIIEKVIEHKKQCCSIDECVVRAYLETPKKNN